MALYEAYNGRCLYCNDLIKYDNYHIDHIIPEYLDDKPEEFKRIKREYELDDDYDLNAYYNLVPTTAGCNIKKRKQIFEKKTALFYISIAKNKIPNIKELEQKIEDQKSTTKLLFKLDVILRELGEKFKIKVVPEEIKEESKEAIDIKSLQNDINFFKKNFDIIKKGNTRNHESRYYSIRREARKIFDIKRVRNEEVFIVKELIEIMCVFSESRNEILINWGLDILQLLIYTPETLLIIKRDYLNRFQELYDLGLDHNHIVDILDECGYYKNNKRSEILRAINKRNVKLLRHLIFRFDYDAIKDSRYEFKDEISQNMIDLDSERNKVDHDIKNLCDDLIRKLGV